MWYHLYVPRTEEQAFRHRARQRVRYAVSTGRLKKPDRCLRCERWTSILHAHHSHGYEPEHALDVVWLCSLCHAAAHPDVQLKAARAGGRAALASGRLAEIQSAGGKAAVRSGHHARMSELGNRAQAATRRAETHCRRGHLWSAANTRIRSNGRRLCRACARGEGREQPPHSVADRLFEKVRRDGPVADLRPDLGLCWPWTGATDSRGYGLVRIAGRLHRAHRVAYALTVGPVKPGLPLKQFACTTAGCCNPGHYRAPLWDATLATLPGAALAARTHCVNDHPLAGPGDRYVRPDGRVDCRRCRAHSHTVFRGRA